MKRVISNYKLITLALAAFLTIGLSQSGFAGTGGNSELVYAGSSGNQPVFILTLHNSESADYVVTIRDASNQVLLADKLSGANISRKYRLDTDDAELIGGTTFEVTNRNTNETTVYKISKTTTIVQDVVVAKL